MSSQDAAEGTGAVSSEEALRAWARREAARYFGEEWDRERRAWDMARAALQRWQYLSVGAVVLIGVAALVLWQLGYREWLIYKAIGAAVAVLLLAAAALYLRRIGTRHKDTSELEQALDLLRRDDLARLAAVARERLAFVDAEAGARVVELTGFPDKQRLAGAFFGGRIGGDGVSRFTPVGLTVFALQSDTVAAFKGAVDLTSGAILYERIVEFPWSQVAALELVGSTVSETVREGGSATAKGPAPRRRERHGPLKDKELLTVRLATGVEIETLLCDRGFVESWRGRPLGAITATEPAERYREVWRQLRTHWLRAGQPRSIAVVAAPTAPSAAGALERPPPAG